MCRIRDTGTKDVHTSALSACTSILSGQNVTTGRECNSKDIHVMAFSEAESKCPGVVPLRLLDVGGTKYFYSCPPIHNNECAWLRARQDGGMQTSNKFACNVAATFPCSHSWPASNAQVCPQSTPSTGGDGAAQDPAEIANGERLCSDSVPSSSYMRVARCVAKPLVKDLWPISLSTDQ